MSVRVVMPTGVVALGRSGGRPRASGRQGRWPRTGVRHDPRAAHLDDDGRLDLDKEFRERDVSDAYRSVLAGLAGA
jgi:hypothetical protein